MLSKLSKKVFAFDIQKEAIENTRKLLISNNVNNVTLINSSHEFMDKLLNDYKNKISLVLFNLGYLPNGNKDITTKANTTLNAIKSSFKLLNKKGIILVVCYPHEEGKKEASVILKYLKKINISHKVYKNTNNDNAPFLIEIKNNSV